MEPSSAPVVDKNNARENRLIRKVNEEVLRKKMENEAKTTCAPYFKAFGDCAKENGLMVVINCRRQNKEMSDCMDFHCSDKKFDEYLTFHNIPIPPKPSPWYSKYIS